MKTLSIFLFFLNYFLLAAAEPPILEKLGNPVRAGSITIFGRTRQPDGGCQAWTRVRLPDRIGLLGIETATGRTVWRDYAPYGSRLLLLRCFNDKVYVFQGGKPARFIEYDPATGRERFFSVPANGAYNVDSSADLSPDGKLYVGLYPETEIACLDIGRGEVTVVPRISPDPRQKYILQLLLDRHNIVYFTVGLHHPEVWSYNPATGEKHQILPEKYLDRTDRSAILSIDGEIYSFLGNDYFRCTPDRMIPVDRLPGGRKPNYMEKLDLQIDPDRRLVQLDSDGRLLIANRKTGETEFIQTDFPDFSPLLYSICRGEEDRIWLGSFTPSALASFRHGDSDFQVRNYGKRGSGSTQIYYTLERNGRIFTSSYVGGWIDEIDLDGDRDTPILSLAKTEQQERLFMLVSAADGRVYAPTMPIKGQLGGGILEWEHPGRNYRFHRHVVPNQSIFALTTTSDPELLFGVSTVAGGTSAIPTEKTARIFLWSTADKKVVWEGEPLAGEDTYYGAHRLSGDLVWTIGRRTRQLVVFDTAKREVVKTIPLPAGRGLNSIGSAPAALGDRAYFFSGDALCEADIPAGRVSVLLRAPEIAYKFSPLVHGTHAEYLHPDGTLYFGSGPTLYRVRLAAGQVQRSEKP